MDFRNNFGDLIGSVLRTWETAVSIFKNRVELAAVELEEEKARLLVGTMWGGVFILASFMAVIAIVSAVLFFFWEQRLGVAIGLFAFCAIGCLTAFLFLKKKMKARECFTESIAQLKKDRAWLQRQK